MKWKLLLGTLLLLVALVASAAWYLLSLAMLEPGRMQRPSDIQWLTWVFSISAYAGIQFLGLAAVQWASPHVRRLLRR